MAAANLGPDCLDLFNLAVSAPSKESPAQRARKAPQEAWTLRPY